MISINESFISTAKMTDRSVVASCLLGFSNLGTGLSGGIAAAAIRPESSVLPLSLPRLNVLPMREVNEGSERATKAPEAVVTAQAQAYAFAAAGAGSKKKTQHQTTQQHHTMWAFRGLEPWSDPV
ncbi:hypothetical protein GCM10009837_57790 [Streptomyces durmitorensis]|uniref:Uncharacterized protein n=1 Tax=Streptomyces durmitorensis TaxID=319947 RepID=A0ABY4PSN4_9ACTN|nr:hypothetical protein [Streptomyces durmitorensis]UQT56420.1 hypothetical protein M4V62_15685 [Streptomyces durmitorensis]